MYEKLGLKEEDEKDRKARERACGRRNPGPMRNECVDELRGGDEIKTVALCDWMNPIMELECRYKDMFIF
jgi:hypothetical protein